MKIKKLKVSNFRNLKNIDIEFGDINILTGKNSSGKTNFIQLIENCLYTDNMDNISAAFDGNITTISQGCNSTQIISTISDLKENSFGRFEREKNISNFYKPKEYIYTIKIFKNPIVINERLLTCKGLCYSQKGRLEEESQIKSAFRSLEKVQTETIIKNIYTESKNENKLFESFDGSNSLRWFLKFKEEVENKIICYDDNSSFSSTTNYIYKFIMGDFIEKKENISQQALERLRTKEKTLSLDFNKSNFYFLLADVQNNPKKHEIFREDLSFYTNSILNSVYINTVGADGSKGDIYVETPHGPRNIKYISAGSSVLLYFILLKNRLLLNDSDKSYKDPDIMVFDELDSILHPSLIEKFSELLKIISKKVQLFITTHSITFIDNFDKKDLYLLKDNGSFSGKTKPYSNILSYKQIINSLGKDQQKAFKDTHNSELYINGYLDSLFPVSIEND